MERPQVVIPGEAFLIAPSDFLPGSRPEGAEMLPRSLIVIPAEAKRRAGTQGNIFAFDFWVPGLPRLTTGVARDDKRGSR